MENGRGFTEAAELEDGPSAPRLPASAGEIPGLGSRQEGHIPAGPRPASLGPVLSPQLAVEGGGGQLQELSQPRAT